MRKEISGIGESLVDNLAWASFDGGYHAGLNGDLSESTKVNAIKAKNELIAYMIELESIVKKYKGLTWEEVSSLCT